MVKMIKGHEAYIRQEIGNCKSGMELKELWDYHGRMVQDFQHERLIHLVVTFMVAMVSLIIFGLTLFYPNLILVILDVILWAVFLFYIRHYFGLENGVQRLYGLDLEIRKKL